MSGTFIKQAHFKNWIADDEAPECMKCTQQFTCFVRRHHCRFCGFVLCYVCVPATIGGLKACNDCFKKNQLAGERSSVLSSSDVLKGKVSHLSPLVQFAGDDNDKRNKGKKIAKEKSRGFGADAKASLTASPRIARSINNLEKMYGGPAPPPRLPSTNKDSSVKVEEKKISKESERRRSSKDREDVSVGTGHGLLSTTSQGSEGPPRAPASAVGKVMVVVDPFSTGAVLVAEILSRGATVVRVLSDKFPDHILNLVLEGIKVEYVATISHQGDLASTVHALVNLQLNLVGVVAGCETGVELADAISEALGVRTNGTKLSDERRNKYAMGEKVRSAGVRAVKQARAKTITEINTFLKQFGTGSFKVVIKPVASAGTDGVYLCRSHTEVHQRFQALLGSTNMLGKTNNEVVIQEFLEGKEYVIDTVSRDGVHKVVTVWEYDKRPCNDAPFVYYGLRLKSSEEKGIKELMEYEKKVLDALEIKNGPAHGEVMLTPNGPCLVEVGARPHGGEGSWVPLVYSCLGSSQVKATVDVYLDPDAFYRLPDYPTLKKFHGLECDLVSQREGKLVAMPKLDQIRKLESFFEMDMFVKPGEKLVKTIDCITMPGSIRLLHADRVQLEADFLRIRSLEESEGFYVVEGDDIKSLQSSSSSSSSSSASSSSSSSSSSEESSTSVLSEHLTEAMKGVVESQQKAKEKEKEETKKKTEVEENKRKENGRKENEKVDTEEEEEEEEGEEVGGDQEDDEGEEEE